MAARPAQEGAWAVPRGGRQRVRPSLRVSVHEGSQGFGARQEVRAVDGGGDDEVPNVFFFCLLVFFPLTPPPKL